MQSLILSSGHQIKQTPNSGGWYTCKCPLCNDYKVRAGFKFENDGFGYNCFNCGTGLVYNPHEYCTFSDDILNLMSKLGIPETSCREIEQDFQRQLLNSGKINRVQSVAVVKSKHSISKIDFPKYFIPLSESTSRWATVARAYLTNTRKVDVNSHNYHILDYDCDSVPVHEIVKWHKRIIIPIFYNGEIVWWQGRDYTNSLSPKYLNSELCGADVLFSRMDKFMDDSESVLILEGFFDALQIDGVACFRNKLTFSQLEFLSSQQKTIIYIPDRLGDGHIAANQIIHAGMAVGLPDIGSCKDIDEAVRMYGKFYVYLNIMQNIYYGDEAKYKLNLYCKKGQK